MAFGNSRRRLPALRRSRRSVLELLEPRLVLHEEGGALDPLFLPTQHRMSVIGGVLSSPTSDNGASVAFQFLSSHAAELGLTADDLSGYVVSSQYVDPGSGTTHLYLQQTYEDLEVMNADLSVHVSARGEVLSVSSRFLHAPQPTNGPASELLVGAPQAFAELASDLGWELDSAVQIVASQSHSPDRATILNANSELVDEVLANLVYVPTPAGLNLAWRLNAQTTDHQHAFDAFVDATSGETLYANDLMARMSYRVFESRSFHPTKEDGHSSSRLPMRPPRRMVGTTRMESLGPSTPILGGTMFKSKRMRTTTTPAERERMEAAGWCSIFRSTQRSPR